MCEEVPRSGGSWRDERRDLGVGPGGVAGPLKQDHDVHQTRSAGAVQSPAGEAVDAAAVTPRYHGIHRRSAGVKPVTRRGA
ncbi:hypothetical protein SUDANB95_05532 [Actinosynnema sp. ALI-1.44]